MPGTMNEENNYHLDSTWGRTFKFIRKEYGISMYRASMIVGMSERAGKRKRALYRGKKKEREMEFVKEQCIIPKKICFLFVLAEAKTAVYGLEEQRKKKNGRYF